MGSKIIFSLLYDFALGVPPLLGLPLNSPLKADPMLLLLSPRLPRLQKPIFRFTRFSKYLPGKSLCLPLLGSGLYSVLGLFLNFLPVFGSLPEFFFSEYIFNILPSIFVVLFSGRVSPDT